MNVRTTFVCGRCEAVLSDPVVRVALPGFVAWVGHDVRDRPVLMTQGTYGVARNGDCVLAPGDVCGTRLVPERSGDSCVGMNVGEEPNLVCGSCGNGVGDRIDDCQTWQETRLRAGAVGAVSEDTDEEPWVNPEEWSGRFPVDDAGELDWVWFGRLGVCAVEILKRSGGEPVYFAPGGALVIREFLRGVLSGTRHADAMRVLRTERDVLVCDLGERSEGRLLSVVPDDGRELGEGRVPLHPDVWSYLAYEHGRPPRVVPGRWRDDEAPRRLSLVEAYSRGNWQGRYQFGRDLREWPEARRAWLDLR